MTVSSSNTMTDLRGDERVDRFGAVASSLCAVHCAVSALLPAAFAVLGLGFLLGHGAEWVLTLIAVAFATAALALGWWRHRSLQVAGFLALGIVGLVASRGIEMSSGHHEHHGAPPQAIAEHAASHDHHGDSQAGEHGAQHPENHGEAHADHDSAAHMIGTVVGVLAGLLLLLGHILNIRAIRRHHQECCECTRAPTGLKYVVRAWRYEQSKERR